MYIPTALFMAALLVGAPQGPVKLGDLAPNSAVGRQGIATGIVLAPAVEGRIAILDSQGHQVVELDKPAGRRLDIALAPGAYEVRIGLEAPRVVRFQVGDGDKFLLDPPHVAEAQALPPPAPSQDEMGSIPSPRPLDARHRVEVRVGGWAEGWSGDRRVKGYSAHGAFGLEYLRFLRNDVGVGVALSVYGRAQGWRQARNRLFDARAVIGLPVLVRWYPARRLTRTRSVEPYVAAGIGPVFGIDVSSADDVLPLNLDGWSRAASRARVSATVGGRVGGGIDFRLGSVFTLGLAGAWDWSSGHRDDFWSGPAFNGGEFTFTMGWQFGR